jgi:deoxyribodipyrimidine photo-lyase
MRPLVWFRTDLRVRDNPALHAAAASATRGVVALYVVSPKDWERHDDAPVKVDFILRNLRELSKELESRNIALLVETAAHFSDVPALVLEAATKHGCDALHFNRDYEVNERERDERTERLFVVSGRKVLAHDGGVALAPGSVLTNDGGFYTVYSPFKRKWRERFDALGRPEPLPMCKKQGEMVGRPGAIPERVKGFESAIDPEEWPAGEAHAKRRMESFLESRIDEYKERRDFPGVNGTSTISPYLTSGVVSARQVIHAAMVVNQHKHDAGKQGVVKWIEEVVWREFYKHMLIGFPRLSKHRPLQLETERIRWKTNDEHLRAWKEGRTGYPMVDAAMRQLTRRGWMHNRVRMITAAFLSKDLFLDWREGERWFMRNLVDGDLANNNGGWQWSASVGADAQPYFRVFNPTSQGERFDPEGDFVREYVDELRDVDAKEIHDPSPLTRERCGYPAPIVDHAKARDEAIEAFKKVKKS